jgi:hypothetical protein
MKATLNMYTQDSPFPYLSLFTVLVVSFATTTSAQSGCVRERVCLKVVAQRIMGDADLRRINQLSLRRSMVRFRLSNSSPNEIVYLTGLGSVEPIGYRTSKATINGVTKFLPEVTERTESDLSSHFGGSLKYLRLPPNASLEFELPDWGNPRLDTIETEHAFSIFIKLGRAGGSDRLIALISEPYRPLQHLPIER